MTTQLGLEELLRQASKTDAYRHLDVSAHDFSSLPLTPASAVKANPGRYLVELDRPALRVATSGSTGNPTVVYRSLAEVQANAKGVADRWEPLLGAGPHRIISLLDHTRSAAGVLVEHVGYALDAVVGRLMPYTPSGPNWEQFAVAVLEFRPTVIIATPGVLLDVEHALRALGVFDEVRVSTRTLLTLGATNTPAMRRRLNRSWEALVVDGSFGGTEPGTVATGCRLGNLHSMIDRGVYEVELDDGSVVPLAPGARGSFVVTPTLFRFFVVLRYVTGDRIDAFTCHCGLDGVAFKVLGRTDDQVKVRGHWLGQTEIEHVIYGDDAVEDYQLVSDLELNLTRVEVSLLPASEHRATSVTATIAGSLGIDTIVISSVSPLARTAGVVKSWVGTRVRPEVTR